MQNFEDYGHCPGCRFKCNADNLQCGRGFAIKDACQEQGVANLSGNGETACRYEPAMTPQAQLSKVVPLVAKQLTKALSESDSRVVGGILDRHGGFMSLTMLAAHAELDRDRLFNALDALGKNGLIVFERIESCGESAELTELGKQQVAIWREEFNEACTEFASSLTLEECQQLVMLLHKLARR